MIRPRSKFCKKTRRRTSSTTGSGVGWYSLHSAMVCLVTVAFLSALGACIFEEVPFAEGHAEEHGESHAESDAEEHEAGHGPASAHDGEAEHCCSTLEQVLVERNAGVWPHGGLRCEVRDKFAITIDSEQPGSGSGGLSALQLERAPPFVIQLRFLSIPCGLRAPPQSA